MQDSLVHLGAGRFSVTPDRSKVVNFSTPVGSNQALSVLLMSHHQFGVEANTILMNTPDTHQAKNIFDPFDKLGTSRLKRWQK